MDIAQWFFNKNIEIVMVFFFFILLLSFFPLLINFSFSLETKLMKCQNGKNIPFCWKKEKIVLLKHTFLFPYCKFRMHMMLKWKKRERIYACVWVTCVCVCLKLSRKGKSIWNFEMTVAMSLPAFFLKGHLPGMKDDKTRWRSK